jgi:hypothetical protein
MINVIVNFNSYFLGLFLLLAVIDVIMLMGKNNVGWRKRKVYLDAVEIDVSPLAVHATPNYLRGMCVFILQPVIIGAIFAWYSVDIRTTIVSLSTGYYSW